MLLATILLLGALPQSVNLAKSVVNNAVAVTEANETVASRELPSMPTPKVAVPASSDASGSGKLNVSSSAVEPAISPISAMPMKAGHARLGETRRQRIAWYALATAGHGAAAFDAYTTRLALSGNYGNEGNPFLRPFAHSNSLYAATQVSPLVMDYLGKRMMSSQDRWIRNLWWVPQVLGGGFSVGAGVHNLSVVK